MATDESCAAPPKLPVKVVVSGAGGQTGQLLFRKMLALPKEFTPMGFVRTPESKDNLVSNGVPAANVAVVDVTDSSAIQSAISNFASDGLAAFCICTSAKPKPTAVVNEETGAPVFGFPDGSPEEVDWIGQKQQIDACPAGTHIVVCSSMGGTDPSNRLNAFGRETLEDGTVMGGNILLWKRKAEIYLQEKCEGDNDLSYTIVHPGGLINEPDGEREIVIGVDDEQPKTDSRSIPRGDVAQVMLQAVRHKEAYKNRSFDIRAFPPGEGTVTTDFEALIASLGGRNSDYSLGKSM